IASVRSVVNSSDALGGASTITSISPRSVSGTKPAPPATCCSTIAPKNGAMASATLDLRVYRAQPTTVTYLSVNRLTHRSNRSSSLVSQLFWCSSLCGPGQYAESIGSSENDTNSDTSTAPTSERANGFIHWPTSPLNMPTGTNTATNENVV